MQPAPLPDPPKTGVFIPRVLCVIMCLLFSILGMFFGAVFHVRWNARSPEAYVNISAVSKSRQQAALERVKALGKREDGLSTVDDRLDKRYRDPLMDVTNHCVHMKKWLEEWQQRLDQGHLVKGGGYNVAPANGRTTR